MDKELHFMQRTATELNLLGGADKQQQQVFFDLNAGANLSGFIKSASHLSKQGVHT